MKYVLLLLILIGFSVCVYGTDDSFKPYLHKASVPQSPKLTIYGQYQTNLYPGSATYSYPIAVPKGINGLSPSVVISYNSQSYRGRSVLGSGWSLSKDYVYRDTKGTLNDTSDDVYILILDGNTYELVYSGGYYKTQVDYYFKIKKDDTDFWEITKPDGTKYRLGSTSDSKISSNTGKGYTVSWYLDTVTDTHGNTISYSYSQNPNTEDSGSAYLSQITYGLNKITFSYENSVRPDRRRVYEQGNLVEESRRLSDISVFSSDNLVSRNHLSYVSLNPSLSAVSVINYYGSDNSSKLYNISFDYYSNFAGYNRTSSYFPPGLFSDNSHNDYGIRFEDVNNDGFMDVLRSTDTNKTVWLNDKNGSWIYTNLFSIPENFTVSNVDQGVRFADINQDGLSDMLVAKSGSARKVYLNNGTGWNNEGSWSLPLDFVDSSGVDLGVQISDVNGDGKIDFVQAKAGTRSVYLHTGSGWTSSSWSVPVDFIDSSNRDTGVRLLDINGDGLPDLMQGLAPSSTKTAWLNTGSGWTSSTSWAPPFYFTTSSYTDNGIRLDDVNGDGLVDIFNDSVSYLNNGSQWSPDNSFKSSESFSSSGYNIGRRLADLNGDGLSDIIVSHQDSTQRYSVIRNYSLPYLLKSIRNAYGGITLINYTTSTQFNNTQEDISKIGFNIFIVSNVVNNNTMTGDFIAVGLTNYSYAFGKYNYNKSEFRGFGLSTEITPSSLINHYFFQDDPRKGKEQKVDIYSLNGSIYSSSVKGYNWSVSSGIYNVSLLFATDYLYDGNSIPAIHNISYKYSNFGLPGQVIDYGDVSVIGDEKFTNYTYTYNFDSWIVNKLSSESLYDSNGVKAKETKYYYDNLGLNGVGSKGELTSTEQWGSSGQNVFTYYSYDSYGNLISSTDPLMRITKYSYDSSHTYLSSEINALGHVKKYSYDAATGNLLWSESNGIRTSFEYDIFGRIIKEIQPYDSSSMPTKYYSYSAYGSAPVSIIVKSKTTANNTDDVYYFYDGSGNLIQLKSFVENNQDIIKNIFYDGFGKITSEQNPYFDSHSLNISNVSSTANKTYYSYDSLDRVYFVRNSDGTNKTVTFDRYNISDFDENSHRHKYELNAFGQIAKVHEYNNFPIDDEYITSYFYDLNGNLVKIVDTKGNVFSFSYDSLGRKTAMSDPDLGNWSYGYDLAGNLLTQTDARNNVTTLSFDNINRIILKKSNGFNLTFNYDLQYYGTLSNITLSDNRSFSYTYDDRFRIIQELQKIKSRNYSISVVYDSQNRVLSESIIDTLSYIYGKQGQLNSISGYINSTSYNPFGAISNRTFANSLFQRYSYDSQNARLTNIYIPSVQNMTYSYDSVGNILSINDRIQARLSSMRYDALDRLIEANVGMDKYRYVFNPIGNIRKIVKNNETTIMAYEGNQAHAPSIITDSLQNGADLYEPRDIVGSRNRTVAVVISNFNNISLQNVIVSVDFGTGVAQNQTMNLSVNQTSQLNITYNYSFGGNYRINVSVTVNNQTDRVGFNTKFGTYLKSLILLDKSISITTFEILVSSNINDTSRDIIWNCSNGLNSFYAVNLSNMSSFFEVMQFNYSSSGSKIFTCIVSSRDGNDSLSLSFNIDSLKIQNFNIMYSNLSRRVVSFDLTNYFYPMSFNLSMNTSTNVSKKALSLSSNERMFAFVEANYSDDVMYSLGLNLSNSETYDTYTDYFTFDGVDIRNYARIDGNFTTKVISFQVVNSWYPGNVSWNLNNPAVNGTLFLNTSESIFVFVANNYTTQGITNLRATANVSLFSDYFVDLFDNRPLELSKFDSIGTNLFEMYAINHYFVPQMMSWAIDNVSSSNALNISSSAFIFVQTNYTSGISIPTARINSTSYNDTEQEVIVI